jgi:hypothetical protein
MNWCTVAPLEYEGALNVPFDLGNSVLLCARPDWLTQKEITYALGDYDRTLLETSYYVLMQEYNASSFGDPDSAWTGERTRSKQQRAEEALNLADTALWLAKPAAIGFRRVVVAHYPSGVWQRVHFGWANPLRSHSLDIENEYERSDLQIAKEINTALLTLGRQEAVWIATRTLWLALVTREWPIRYLLLWTALETLFGPEDGREITYRIAQRLAFFISVDRAEARKRFQMCKKGYEWRCRVVHGMRLRKLKPQESERLMHEVEYMIRTSIKRILLDKLLTREIDGTDRERFLDDLVFSNQ